nr:ribonuclease H-like domain-containing protein [Tanacetum cinerariifolium]
MAFISSAKNSSGNGEVNNASIPTASTQVSPAGPNVATASISLDTACAYIASQSNGSQIKYEDINQVDEHDIEEMDIKWNMSLLSMRADRYWKKTGKKNLFKVLMEPRSQKRGRKENYRQGSKEEEQAPKALMAIDEVGWDWSFMANEEENHALVADEEAPTEFALMAKSSTDNEVFDNSLCFKACKKNTDSLNNDTKTEYSRPSPAIESNSYDLQNRNPSVTENGTSSSTILSKPAIKFMKATERPTETKSYKVETVKKPSIKYAEMYRKTSKRSNGKSQINIDDKGYWDSGCSRHMTGNRSYLSDYKPFDEGYVSFGQGGSKITGKGTIKTGKQHKASYKTKLVNSVTKPFGLKQLTLLVMFKTGEFEALMHEKFQMSAMGELNFFLGMQVLQKKDVSIPTASTQVSPAGPNVATASISLDAACAYIASQSNGYWKKTGKKIFIQGTDVAGFDKSKVKCFNCHKMGHFARECKEPRSQKRGRKENYKQGSKEEEQAPKALMAIDEVGWDWSFMENEEENHALVADEEAPTEFALMAKSSTDNETLKKEKEGLDSKLTDDTKTEYSRPSPAIESNSDDLQNRNPSVTENGASSSTILSKPVIKFMKATERPTETKSAKVETVKKPSVKYAEMYRKTSKRSNVRVRTQVRVPRVPTVNRKFPTVYRKFPTGNSKFSTTDMGNKGTASKSHINIDDKGYWDSGCSRHMTGNRSYLSDYKPFDEGYVSFGQGGSKITGKGTIKTECIVLGRNFKLTDDTNVLLRTPRQHNMYPIDLNNVFLHKDLTCLVAKASVDECMLWHMRLGHLNIKTMNRLVRHNLVIGLPSKCFDNDHTCVACLKGKQHKASYYTNGVEADLGNMEYNISASPTPTFRIHKDHPKSQIIGPVDTPVQSRTKSKEMEEQSFIATIHQKINPALL